MTAGRPRKPLERSTLLAAGDGLGTSHASKPKAGTDLEIVQGEIVEYQPTQLDILKPADLGTRGSREWDNIWKAGKTWLHESEDYHLVEIVARAYDEIEIYRAEIYPPGERPKLIVKGYAGQKTANPLIKEIREAERVILKCLSMLGFSPSDRARLGLKAVRQAQGIQQIQKAAAANR